MCGSLLRYVCTVIPYWISLKSLRPQVLFVGFVPICIVLYRVFESGTRPDPTTTLTLPLTQLEAGMLRYVAMMVYSAESKESIVDLAAARNDVLHTR